MASSRRRPAGHRPPQAAPQPAQPKTPPRRPTREYDPWYKGKVGWSITLGALVVALGFGQGLGNEHGIDQYGQPKVNTMPSFPVEIPSESIPGAPAHAKRTGALVCPQIFAFEDSRGQIVKIVNPVVARPDATVPLDLVNVDQHGPQFSLYPDNIIVHSVVLNPDGSADGSRRFHGCVRQDITTVQVTDSHNPQSHPYVLAGPNSQVQDGDAISLTMPSAEQEGLVNFAVVETPGQDPVLVDLLRRS